MDMLRTCKIDNFNMPIGTSVRFDNKEIGQVIANGKGYCKVAINNEFAYSAIRYRHSFGMEVICND